MSSPRGECAQTPSLLLRRWQRRVGSSVWQARVRGPWGWKAVTPSRGAVPRGSVGGRHPYTGFRRLPAAWRKRLPKAFENGNQAQKAEFRANTVHLVETPRSLSFSSLIFTGLASQVLCVARGELSLVRSLVAV